MRRIRITSFILMLLLPIAACSLLQDDENPQSVDESPASLPQVKGVSPNGGDIVGSWEWIGSIGGIAGVTITPDSEGHSAIQIRFRDDKTFSVHRADTLFVDGSYSLEPPEDQTLLHYQVMRYQATDDRALFDQLVQISARKDTLALVDFCCDGFSSLYSRLD